MYFFIWVDLKGEDFVLDIVYYVVVLVNFKIDRFWERFGKSYIRIDDVYVKDNIRFGVNSLEMWFEVIKILKGEYVVWVIKEYKMD